MSDHTPEQIASAYATLDLALAHRQALDMSIWVRPGFYDGEPVTLDDLVSECGTTACYAGWHVARLGHKIDADGDVLAGGVYRSVARVAREDLGLTEFAADHLFLATYASDLACAIAEEFGPRPVTA